jgi:DNA methyltransferase 1-associated protein 1
MSWTVQRHPQAHYSHLPFPSVRSRLNQLRKVRTYPSSPPLFPISRLFFLSDRAIADALHCIQRSDGTTLVGTTTKTSHQATYLRSFRVAYPKAAVAAKVTQIANELGISLSRLVMPTRDTLLAHEALLEAITSLVELKKVADRVDQEIRTAKMRLGMRESEAPAGGPMNVDEEGQAPDTPGEGRAHSVVSTRSGRSRKQASPSGHPLSAY